MQLNTKPLAADMHAGPTPDIGQLAAASAGSCGSPACGCSPAVAVPSCDCCNGSGVISIIKEGQVVGTSPCVCRGGSAAIRGSRLNVK